MPQRMIQNNLKYTRPKKNWLCLSIDTLKCSPFLDLSYSLSKKCWSLCYSVRNIHHLANYYHCNKLTKWVQLLHLVALSSQTRCVCCWFGKLWPENIFHDCNVILFDVIRVGIYTLSVDFFFLSIRKMPEWKNVLLETLCERAEDFI